MAVYHQYGLLFKSSGKTNGVPFATAGSPALSIRMTINPDPALPVARRIKPAERDLVFSGTAYNKSRSTISWGQVAYSFAYDMYGYGQMTEELRFRTSADSIPEINGEWLAPYPLDPMNQLIGKIRSDVTNLGEMLGEYHKTAKLFEDTVVKVVKSFKALKRRDVRGVKNALKGIGRASYAATTGGSAKIPAIYLHWKFGMLTLIDDLHKSIEEIKKGVQESDPVIRVSVRKTHEASGNFWTPYGTNPKGQQRVVTSRQIRQLVAYVEIDNTFIKSLGDHGLTNVPSLAWELTPFSWFVDYFVNVGEWLSALDFNCIYKRSVVYETITRMQVDHTEQFDIAGLTTLQHTSNFRLLEHPVGHQVRKEKIRQLRVLSAVAPQWRPKPSTGHILNSIAALVQLKVR